jgi:3-oxoacyl-[acyl-carrier protein] reductase
VTQLEGRLALVTGAGRNIGRQIALTLGERGCDVAVCVGSDAAGGEEVASAIRALGRRSIGLVADVSRWDDVKAMVARIRQELGVVDVLVNNAAIRPHAAFVEMTEADWRHVLGVNLDGPFFCCKETVPGMIEKGGGVIVNVSGTAAWDGGVQDSHIVASKAGLHGLTKALAVELGGHGIRVNTVVFGAIETVRKLPAAGPGRPLSELPLRRRGTVADAAEAVAFLASDDAAYVTGQALHVNGGVLLA